MIKQAYKANPEQLQLQIKLNHIEPVNPKKVIPQPQEPSYREVIEMLETLKDKMGDRDVQKIIEMLYNNLIFTKQSKQLNINSKKSLKHWEQLPDLSEINIPPIAKRQYIIRPLIKEKKFFRKQAETKYLQKQLIAKSLIQKDYGLQHLQASIVQTNTTVIIKRHRYTDLAYGSVTQGYRLLQHFLIHECKRSIKPSDKYEMSALHQVLCNCRIHLTPQDTLTFFKFLKIAFDLQSATVTEEDAVKLYISLQKCIRKRVGERQLDRSQQKKNWTKYIGLIKRQSFQWQQFQKFVNPSIQKVLVNIYLKCELFSELKALMIEKYPEKQHLFTLDSVTSVICKIVRIAIKRVFYYKQKFKHEKILDILPLDSTQRCKITKANEALKARRLLLKLWKTKQSRILKRLPRVIHQMNKYVAIKEQQKANFIIAKAKPETNAVQKLDFNINVSRTKLTEGFKTSCKDEVVLKGTQSNYQHFINSENGKKLHYYRKIQQQSDKSKESESQVKIQPEQIANTQKDSGDSASDYEQDGNQSTEKPFDEQKGSVEQNKSYSSQNSKNAEQNQTELKIKQWLSRLNLSFFKCIS